MMKNTYILSFGLLMGLCIALSACKKEDAPDISTTPSISFIRVTPQTVKEYSDSIVFTIGYEDGDGDLGENVDTVKNVFITDNRMNLTYKLRLSQLAPTGANVAIKGNAQIILKNTIITDNSNSQQATFNIYVVDRAKHRSNTVTISSI